MWFGTQNNCSQFLLGYVIMAMDWVKETSSPVSSSVFFYVFMNKWVNAKTCFKLRTTLAETYGMSETVYGN